jgi:hypothetical protein
MFTANGFSRNIYTSIQNYLLQSQHKLQCSPLTVPVTTYTPLFTHNYYSHSVHSAIFTPNGFSHGIYTSSPQTVSVTTYTPMFTPNHFSHNIYPAMFTPNGFSHNMGCGQIIGGFRYVRFDYTQWTLTFGQGQCSRPTTSKDTTRIARVRQHRNRESHIRPAWEGLAGMGTSNAFKVTMKLQTFLFQMGVTPCISVQYLWKCGFAK